MLFYIKDCLYQNYALRVIGSNLIHNFIMNRKYQRPISVICVVIVNSLMLGLFGVLARIKKPMAEEFDISEDFLGTLDSLTFIGGILGFLYVVLFPSKKPVRDLTLQCLGVSIFLGFYYFAHLIGQPKIWLCIGTLLSGYGRSYTVVAFTIINHHYHETKCDKIILQICFALAMMGDIGSVLISDYMIDTLQISWSSTLNIYLGVFLLSALLMYALAPEISLNEKKINKRAGLYQIKNFIKKYSKNPSNILHGLMFSISCSGYYMMLMWLPFYFEEIGFQREACLISSVYPIAYMIGIFLLQPVQKFFGKFIGIVLIVSLVLATICSFLLTFLGNDPQQIPYYIVCLAFSTILTSGCIARVTTIQIEDRTKSGQQFMIISSFLRLVQQLFFGVNLEVSGILMDVSIHSFFYIQLFYSVFSTILCVVRVIKYPRDFILKQNVSIGPIIQENTEQNEDGFKKGPLTTSTLSDEFSLQNNLIIHS